VTRWIALFRGINVGGHNRLPMGDLTVTMQSLGFDNVVTYVQSGNVVFDAGADVDADASALVERITAALEERHGLSVPALLRTAAALGSIAQGHPDAGSGLDPKLLHVVFLDRAPDASAAATIDPARYAPDGWTVDGDEIYVRYPQGSGRSKLTIDVFERALNVTATARNLNTVRKLVELAAAG